MEDHYAIDFAQHGDENGWMRLVETVQDNFPGLVMEDYRRTLVKNIERGSAICARCGAEIVGILMFSIWQKTLSCMAVHPAHRKKGLASGMIRKMIAAFPQDSDIWVTTFREGDPMGDAPRALYHSMGFQAEELVEEFGYPCQRFVLRGQR
jgi:GNAT superfamily N-acetyltransferase